MIEKIECDLVKGEICYCIKSRYNGDTCLFEKGIYYEFVVKEILKWNDISYDDSYILDRVDNGIREIFYDTDKFNEFFVDMDGLRKLKLDNIGL